MLITVIEEPLQRPKDSTYILLDLSNMVSLYPIKGYPLRDEGKVQLKTTRVSFSDIETGLILEGTELAID